MEAESTKPEGEAKGAGSRRSGSVQSVDRAVLLLKAVADSSSPETVATLAAQVGLNRATAWRLLSTLEYHGLVERDDAGRYRIGFSLIPLAAGAGYTSLLRLARPHLVELSNKTGETAALAVPDRLHLAYVDEIVPPSVLSASWVDRSAPLHATSSGKALLAWMPEREASTLLESLPLTPFTANTLSDPARLKAELGATRARGYATCSAEFEETLSGVAAPVLCQERVVAIISIWGASERMVPERIAELGRLAVRAAGRIAAALGS